VLDLVAGDRRGDLVRRCRVADVALSGYTPVFDTVFDGTLCGKWPELPVWLTLLPLADWRGHIDMTPEAIAARTGWPLQLLLDGIAALCQPDPRSRSKAEEGRRLTLIDPERPWGWKVVNIGVYRVKASSLNQSKAQIADGRNAEKVRRYKERHRQTPVDTSEHRGHQHSDSDSDSDSDSEKIKNKNPPLASARVPPKGANATRLPPDFELTPERRAIAEAEKADPEREFASFTDHFRAAPGVKGRKNDWDATWRNWCRRAPDFKPRAGARKPDYVPPKTIDQLEAEERARDQH
jgi:hypothetical protein